jgi:uncharacterized protein (DUF4415 family)
MSAKSSALSRREKQRGGSIVTLKKIPKLTAKMRKELRALENMRDDQIDTSDIPERLGARPRHVGLFHRPEKKSITIRLDADLLAWFKKQGRGYQTKMNAILREYFATHR